MARAKEEEANHWPGFVDALSTIVMVVTFLLIILAVAIFIMSLSIAKHANPFDTEASANMPETRVVRVTEQPIETATDVELTAVSISRDVLKIEFERNIVAIDDLAKIELTEFFDTHKERLLEGNLEIYAYFDPNSSAYTKMRRIAYYRTLAVRGLLLENEFTAAQIQVHLREAPVAESIDTIEVHHRP